MTDQLDAIFRPRSIAVIGASTTPGALGRQILQNLVTYRYRGKLYPVNPKAREIFGLRCFSSLQDINDPIDLAVVVVRRELAIGAVEECGRKGIPGVVVITAGFREVGGAGAELEAQLVALARQYGFRLVGPNCMGVINTDAEVRMNATFAPTMPFAGNVAFLSQSGALGVAILNIAEERNLALSSFASLGNKADVSDDDALAYWAADPRTSVIAMYLESFGNPARFAQVARAVSRRKPLLIVKSGKTQAGARAAVSHTGALAEASDAALDGFLRACGVLRVATVDELFDLSAAFARNPLACGPRVAVISNAGGPAILATDAVIGNGLAMAELSPQTLAALRPRLPAHATVSNPLDMLPTAAANEYGFALRSVLTDPGVDMALVIFVPPMMVDPIAVIGALEAVRRAVPKPVIGVMMAPEDARASLRDSYPEHLALCQFPESAARALAALELHRRWVQRDAGRVPEHAVNRAAAENVIAAARAECRRDLHLREALEVLTAYGIPVVRYAAVRSAEEAEAAAARIGFPVAMKISHGGVAHKTEARGVVLNVRSTDQAFHTYHGLTHVLADHLQIPAAGRVVVVQEMAAGRETVLGMVRDPHLGPLLMFGLGGVLVETLRDVAFHPAPLSDRDAQEMIASIRGYPILRGVRGQKPVAFSVLEDALTRLSQLVMDFDCIQEIDINPFFASELQEACKAADVRIRLS
jgi:acetyl coenzyme A synthetase (ADP forming)-like protein